MWAVALSGRKRLTFSAQFNSSIWRGRQVAAVRPDPSASITPPLELAAGDSVALGATVRPQPRAPARRPQRRGDEHGAEGEVPRYPGACRQLAVTNTSKDVDTTSCCSDRAILLSN